MIYTNLKAKERKLHGIFESSLLLATDVGDLYDALVHDKDDKEIDVDNGVAIAVNNYTGNGLQERYAKIAGAKDKIAVTGAPANVKTALTTEEAQSYNYTNPAGKPVKAYQIQDPSVHTDIFGVAAYQFTDDTASKVEQDALVVVDGNGMWQAHDADDLETLKKTNGFVGKIHSISVGTYYDIVRIQSLQNKTIAEEGGDQ